MLNCLTYIAFVYWAVATVHTVLPIDVAVCGADPSRGGMGALLHHTFGGQVDMDSRAWEGYPCNSGLLMKFCFILTRPGATVRHIMTGGGQDEPFVPILFVVPLAFLFVEFIRRFLGVQLMSDTAARTMLKFGIAVGCRGMILLQSLLDPTKQSTYYKRYSKVEFFIIAWTAYIIELPVWNEALVSGGSLACIAGMCCLFHHHMLPEVNPWNVAIQGILATALGVGHASYQQRRRLRTLAARAARSSGLKHLSGYTKEVEDTGASTATNTVTEEGSAAGGAGVSTFGTVTTVAMTLTPPEEAKPKAKAIEAQKEVPTEIQEAGTEAAAQAAAAAGTGDAAALSGSACADGAAGAALAPASPHPGGSDSYYRTSVCTSLEVLRRINARGRVRSYVSPARSCRFSIKVQHAHLTDLPSDLVTVLNTEVLAGSGWQAVSAYAREGCVELVLDLRPILPARPPAAATFSDASDDSRAQPDQDHQDSETDDAGGGGGPEGDGAAAAALDEATLRDLGRSVVSYLQASGVILPDREPSVVLQLGDRTAVLTWQPETQAWAFAFNDGDGEGDNLGGGGEASADGGTVEGDAAIAALASAVPMAPPPLLPAGVPVLYSVCPRLAVWPGPGAPLRLRVVVRGPSAEEILVGGGLVVRQAGFLLPYSVIQCTRQAPPAHGCSARRGSAASPAATAASPASSSATPVLVVHLAVNGAPSSGLLRVEARTASGLLSAPLAVVVDHDEELVSGLEGLLAGMDEQSADAVLTDFGLWMDAAMAAVGSYTERTVDGGGGGGKGSAGGKDVPTAPPSGAAGGSAGGTAADVTCPAGAAGAPPSAALLARIAGPAADMPYMALPYMDRHATQELQLHVAAPPALQSSMMTVAADLLALCCQAGGTDPAIAAVAERLLVMVAACDGRSAAAAVAALLAAVPTPPTNAGALHLAIAAGSRPVAAVLLSWHSRLYGGISGATAGTAAVPDSMWLSRASCGVTPLHVAAAMSDGGAMAAWALDCYPAAAALWRTAASDDGLTPAMLAAQLGGRWRLRMWHANPVVQEVRRALAPPAALKPAIALLWGFDDPCMERRYAARVSSQTVAVLSLYTVINAALLFLAVLKAILYGSSRGAGSEISLLASALAFHVPHTAPLLAWFCARNTQYGACTISSPFPLSPGYTIAKPALAAVGASVASTAASSAAAVAAAAAEPFTFGSQLGSFGLHLAGLAAARRFLGLSSGAGSGLGLRQALLTMHVCRAAAKACAGLSVWPFGLLPRGAALFLSLGGDIWLEAMMRPLLEQVELPGRLLVSLVDAPAMYLLYRGADRMHPGLVPRPLQKLVLYQVVLLSATAAIAATNRALFLSTERARTAALERRTPAVVARPAGGRAVRCAPSRSASASSAVAQTGNSTMGAGPTGRKSDDQCRPPAAAPMDTAPGATAAASAGSVTGPGGWGCGPGVDKAGVCGRLWPRRKAVLPSLGS